MALLKIGRTRHRSYRFNYRLNYRFNYRSNNTLRQTLITILFALVATMAFGNDQHEDLTLRSTKDGTVSGGIDVASNSHYWLGIPYARPPVDELRWKAPRNSLPWQGVRKSVDYGNSCVQSVPTFTNNVYVGSEYTHNSYEGSEDCLYLNIWSPSFSPDEMPAAEERLPVMVWIHGGGNIAGNGQLLAGRLASSQNVIVVSMNYRLGSFGWLSHPALRALADNPDDASGNFGTLDIIQSLEWVRDNIAQFGGDANRVTVFGVSAGAWNIHALLHSPRAEGLFHGAIAQSGWASTMTVAKAEHFIDDPVAGHPQSANELLVQLIIDQYADKDRAAAKRHLQGMNNEAIVSFLKSQSYPALEQAFDRIARREQASYIQKEEALTVKLKGYLPASNGSVPKLFQDGSVISKQPRPVPVIVGSNRDEATIFLSLDPDYMTLKEGKRSLLDKTRYQLTNEYISQLWKVADADELARAYQQQPGDPVYVYRFDWDEMPDVEGESLASLYGAYHALDVAFILGMDTHFIENGPLGESSGSLAAAMMSYWAEFAYNGAPAKGRHGKLPEWQAWTTPDAGGEQMMLLDSPDGGGLRLSGDLPNKQAILDRLVHDDRVADPQQRCRLYQDLLAFPLTYFTYSDYQRLAKGLPCASTPD